MKIKHQPKSKYKFTFAPPWRGVDLSLLLIVIALASLGVLLVYNASLVEANSKFGDPWHFAKQQLLWLGISTGAMFVTMSLPLEWWKRNAKLFLWITVFLLAVVLLGSKTLGAKRWLSVAGFNLQPSELAKISLSAYLAKLSFNGTTSIKNYFITAGLVLILMILQPDMDTMIVLAASVGIIYWLSGAPTKHLVYLIGVGILGGLGLILSSSYRMDRLTSLLNVTGDTQDTSYHAWQVLIALGSGGLFGTGLGQSRQKYGFLPEVAGDSIFAIIAEELGFIGGAILVLALLYVILRSLRAAGRAEDKFAQLFGAGLTTWLAVQILVNIFSIVGLIPLSGITLPFISYGGSSLLITMATMGIILKISKNEDNSVSGRKNWKRS